MKSFIEIDQLTELSQDEMLTTDGGGMIGDAVYSIGHAIGSALGWLRDNTPADGAVFMGA